MKDRHLRAFRLLQSPGQIPGTMLAGSTLARHKVDCRVLASSINLDIELHPVALVKAGEARALDCADMYERIRLAIITGNEPEALHGVEELDSTRGLVAGQLTLRRRFALFDGDDIAHDLQVGSRNLAAAIDQLEFQLLTFGQAFKAGTLDRTDVDEHIIAAFIALDETEALGCVEKLDDALALTDDLGRHPAAATRGTAEAATTAAATEATAAATAETVTAAAETAATAKAIAAAAAVTAAEPVAATRKPILTAEERIEIVFPETITLVASPSSATSSIKTHLYELTFAPPKSTCQDAWTNRAKHSGRATSHGQSPLLRGSSYTSLGAIANTISWANPDQGAILAASGGKTALPRTRLPASRHPSVGLGATPRTRPHLPEPHSMFRKITDSVFASPQITVDQIAEAKALGVTLVINNRPEGESDDQTPGSEIAAAARAAGMDYVAIPVTHSGFSQSQVDAMEQALAGTSGPVLAYCRSGTRSTLLWALARARAGENPVALTAQAAEAGYDVSPVRPLMDMLAAGKS